MPEDLHRFAPIFTGTNWVDYPLDKAVKQGAAYLDSISPDWHQLIDLDRLDQGELDPESNTGAACVLCQIVEGNPQATAFSLIEDDYHRDQAWGLLESERTVRFEDALDALGLSWDEAIEYGFYTLNQSKSSYHELDELWEAEIRARRGEHLDS